MRLFFLGLVLLFGLFSLSGLSPEQKKSQFKFEKKFDVVESTSVAQEQMEIISEMKIEVGELFETTCKLHHMLTKSTGENEDVRRDCKPRSDRDSKSTSRSGETHRGGNGYHLTATTER